MYFLSEDTSASQSGMTPAELRELTEGGVVDCVKKDGRIYYSSREIYRIKAIRFLIRTKGLTLDKAREEVDKANEHER